MVLVGHPGELLKAHSIVFVGVPHAGLGEHARHGLGAQDSIDGRHRPVATRRLVDIGLVLGSTPEKAHLAHLLHTKGQAHFGLASLDGQVDGPDGRGPCGTSISHVVDGNAGLADLLLDPLTHPGLLKQCPCGQDIHVVDGHPAVSQCIDAGLRGKVHGIQVRIPAESGHARSKHPHCIAHRVLLFLFTVRPQAVKSLIVCTTAGSDRCVAEGHALRAVVVRPAAVCGKPEAHPQLGLHGVVQADQVGPHGGAIGGLYDGRYVRNRNPRGGSVNDAERR